MLHKEFIDKFNRYLEVYNFHNSLSDKSFKVTADKFGISPRLVGIRVKFVEDHKTDPKHPELGGIEHNSVVWIGVHTDLSDINRTQLFLVNNYKAKDLNGAMNYWPEDLPAVDVRKLLKAYGIKFFDLEGKPFVHWSL